MSNGAFALLFGKILRSSIWLEDYSTRLVWITLLLLKDKDGMVPKSSVAGLAHMANVTVAECEEALKLFKSPDVNSGSQVDEGRRIRDVDGGWKIVNHEEYQFSTEAKRLAWAEHKRIQREREKEKRGAWKKRGKDTRVAFEGTAVRAMERGDEAEVDRLAATRKDGKET